MDGSGWMEPIQRVPLVGEIIQYRLDQHDVDKLAASLPEDKAWIWQNQNKVGQWLPAIVTVVWDVNSINAQLILDAPPSVCMHWIMSRPKGLNPGQWRFIEGTGKPGVND